MYNKKVLREATKSLDRTVAPAKKKDKVVGTSKPIVSTQGYKQGPPPAGTHYRIPGNGGTTSIYNPTPYPLNLVGPNGTQAQIGPWDTDIQNFNEPYIDESLAAYGGDISIPDLNQYEDGGEYDLTDDEIRELKKGGYVVHELPSIPKKKNSKRYSRSLMATNQLFAQNALLKKQKSKKRKIFNPDSKYYAEGGFHDDLGKHRQLIRDWTYGADIGMLQKAQIGLNTGTRVSEEEVKGLQEAKAKELSYAKTAAQKAEVTKRYDKLLQDAGYRVQASKQQQKAAPKQVVQNIKQTSDKAKAQRIANEERALLNRTVGAGPGSSTYVTPNKVDIPVSSTPLEDKKAIDEYTQQLVNKGVAAETLGNRYWEQSGDKDLSQMMRDKYYFDPNAADDIEEAEYRIWKRGEEKAYQNAPWYDKTLNELTTFTADAPGQIMRTLQGKRSLMGQGYRSLNPEDYDDSRFYDRTLGYNVEGPVPWLNDINPLRYASKAGVDVTKGNAAGAAKNIGLALLSGTGLGVTAQGINALSKASLPFLSKYSGATYGNLAKAYFPGSGAARDLGFGAAEDPSSLRIVDRMIAGKTPVREGLSNIGLNMLDYSPIGRLSKTPGKIIPRVKLTETGRAGLQELQKDAQPVVNFLDKPRFALTASKPTLSRPLPISIGKPVAGPLLKGKRNIAGAENISRNFSVADVLRNATVARTAIGLKNLPSLSNAVTATTSDKPWEQKYEDLKDVGYQYGTAGLGLAPVFGPAGRALYASNPATTAYFADYMNKLNQGNYEGFRGIFPAARILTGRKEGGDVWEDEIDDETRAELEAQGYIIEDLD
jgi:hypothetical protein